MWLLSTVTTLELYWSLQNKVSILRKGTDRVDKVHSYKAAGNKWKHLHVLLNMIIHAMLVEFYLTIFVKHPFPAVW